MRQYFFIPEEGLSEEDQKIRNEIATIRISKVLDYIIEDSPHLIPFKATTPLIKDIDYTTFENEIAKQHYFKDLPRFIKEVVYKAEQMKYYDNLFKNYLMNNKITRKEYKSKNPKIKEDIFYDWLFMNHMDVSILEL